MLDGLITWTIRSLHVLGAALWVGGYAVMLFVIVPHLRRERDESIRRLAMTTVRVFSFSGTLTIAAGLLLIWRTRGYGRLLGGEWGGIVITCAVLAVALMAIGDSGLRPALRRLDPDAPTTVAAVWRWALAGLLVGAITLFLMTRTIYAPT